MCRFDFLTLLIHFYAGNIDLNLKLIGFGFDGRNVPKAGKLTGYHGVAKLHVNVPQVHVNF